MGNFRLVAFIYRDNLNVFFSSKCYWSYWFDPFPDKVSRVYPTKVECMKNLYGTLGVCSDQWEKKFSFFFYIYPKETNKGSFWTSLGKFVCFPCMWHCWYVKPSGKIVFELQTNLSWMLKTRKLMLLGQSLRHVIIVCSKAENS